jgi:trans-aconitate methyltransferase
VPAVSVYFDGQARGYRAASTHGLWAWQRRREAQAVLALAGGMAGQVALDLGCGAGFYADLLLARGARPVIAVDASNAMLDQIADPRVETVVGDVATVALGHRFDLIILAGVLEFVADATAVLINAHRHLADGARIIVLLPVDNAAGRLYRLFHRSHGIDISLFSQTRIGALATAAGLRRTSQRSVWPHTVVCTLVAP